MTRFQHKKTIRAFAYFLAAVALLMAGISILTVVLPVDSILEKQARQWLQKKGIDADFTIAALDAKNLAVENIRLRKSEDVQIGRIHAQYTLRSLTSGHVQAAEIEDASLVLRDTGKGISLSGLESLFQPDARKEAAGTALPSLPFDLLTVRNFNLRYQPQEAEALRMKGHGALKGDYTGEVIVDEAHIPLGDEHILLSNLRLTRAKPDDDFAFNLERIAHITEQKAYFAPLKASGRITLAKDNTYASGTITISDLHDVWILNIQGEARLDKGTWNMTFEQHAITFESGILQPDMLFPILRGRVAQASGGLALKGAFAKSGAEAEIASEGEVHFSELAAVVQDIPVSGVNGVLKLSSLWPLASDGQQVLDVKEIQLGLPLSNGQLKVTLDKDGTAHFAPSIWEWANGKLQTAGMTINLYDPKLPDITLSAQDLALEELLSSLLQQGLSTTGKLSGTIPVHFTKEGEAMIREGRLDTTGGGVVRYLPGAESPLQKGSSFQTDLLLQAMENFHYETLYMTINSKTPSELEVALHVKGRNPELYSGQTIELNVQLTGNLLDVVQSGMDVYSLPERLQEQLVQ